MSSLYQRVNEELAKGIKMEYMSSEIAGEINNANDFLMSQHGTRPSWLSDFFESNKSKLVETICRAISKTDGITSLNGYSEGYFNEIIQNANDLHFGNTVYIDTQKKGSTYSVNCKYKDRGFSLSNIYGFLNREMSDKSADDGQTGKFGVGIKSFFKFVDALKIVSNVGMSFDINRLTNDVYVSGDINVNSEWDGENTSLLFSYNSGRKSEFNITKLSSFVDCLHGFQNDDLNKYFVSGNDNELLFDIRSLIFMQISGWKKNKETVSKLVFSGKLHQIELSCNNIFKPEVIKVDNDEWAIFNISIGTIVDGKEEYLQEFMIFENAGMSFGFPVNDSLEGQNRLYSTFFLKSDVQKQIVPLSMIIDTKYANIHRNDVGDSEENIKRVYDELKKKMRVLYSCMCSERIADLKCKNKVSDIFHSLLLRFIDIDCEMHEESPLGCFDINSVFLPKQLESEKKYVVKHADKEQYQKMAYFEGDIARELTESYFDYVEKNEVLDYEKLVNSVDCIPGVKRLLMKLSDDSVQVEECIVRNLIKVTEIVNYFDEVRDFLAFRICAERRINPSVTDAEIDRWLIDLSVEVRKYYKPEIFLKLVGRYKLNFAIDFDGTIRSSNLSFKDYLFNETLGSQNGILAAFQNKQFDDKYFSLKQELLKKRYRDDGNKNNPYAVRCINPMGKSLNNWDGTFDYYGFSNYESSKDSLSEPELFLEKLATDTSFDGSIHSSTMRLFEKKARGFWRRDYAFKHSYVIEQQIIDISALKQIQSNDFANFISALKYRKMLSPELAEKIHLRCVQKEIASKTISEYLLPLMIETQEGEKKAYLLDEYDPSDAEILSVVENTNDEVQTENREFVRKITDYIIHLCHFESNTRRKIVAYFGAGKVAIKTEASKNFRQAATYSSKSKDIYIFYDNYANDVNDAIALVLGEVGISQKTLELLQGYIHNGNNTKTMNYMSRRRTIAKVKKKLVLEWSDIQEQDVTNVYNNEILYRLLTARGSYDIFCPICADIPNEVFDYGEDTKKKHSRKIIVVENENPETCGEVPYIITVACSYCFDRLRNTLSKSEFDGKHLILTTMIAHGQHEKMKSKRQVELSPINIALMKRFKMR